MMKRGMAFLLIMSIMLGCTACMGDRMFVPQENVNYNYNNISAENSGFWLTNDAVYYKDAPIWTLFYYSMTQSRRRSIACAGNAAFAKILEYEQTLYMLDWIDDSEYRLHSYDLETGQRREIAQLNEVRTFFVLNEYVYYLCEDFSGDRIFPSFHACSLEDGSQRQIADAVLTAGVVDGSPVYVVQDDDRFSIWSYGVEKGASALLGDFEYQLGNHYLSDGFSFTSERFIFTAESDEADKLVCYDFMEDQVTEYPIGDWIYSAVAYEDYVFLVVCTEAETGDSDLWENVVYRLCLQDGSMEQVARLNGMVDTFVGADESVYVCTTLDWDHIYRYDADGTKTLAFAR